MTHDPIGFPVAELLISSDIEAAAMTPLDHRISHAQADLVSLTQELIRIPTVNPLGPDYAAVCYVIERHLAPHGFQVQRVRAKG